MANKLNLWRYHHLSVITNIFKMLNIWMGWYASLAKSRRMGSVGTHFLALCTDTHICSTSSWVWPTIMSPMNELALDILLWYMVFFKWIHLYRITFKITKTCKIHELKKNLTEEEGERERGRKAAYIQINAEISFKNITPIITALNRN